MQRSTTYKGIPIADPLSPRTQRFFQEHGATITADYIDLGTVSITETQATDFVLQRLAQDLSIAINSNRDENTVPNLKKSVSSGSADNQYGTFPGIFYSIELSGNHDGYIFASILTEISSDRPGICRIGILNKQTNECHEVLSFKKELGQDFILQYLIQKEGEPLKILIGTVAVPPNYNHLPWKMNFHEAFQRPKKVFQLNCTDNTTWYSNPADRIDETFQL